MSLEDLLERLDPVPYGSAGQRILLGRYDVFAMRDAPLGFPPTWNRDPKSGRMAPMVFGNTLNYGDEAQVGDIKCLWEINRHLELVTLAQAFRLSSRRSAPRPCTYNPW